MLQKFKDGLKDAQQALQLDTGFVKVSQTELRKHINRAVIPYGNYWNMMVSVTEITGYAIYVNDYGFYWATMGSAITVAPI